MLKMRSGLDLRAGELSGGSAAGPGSANPGSGPGFNLGSVELSALVALCGVSEGKLAVSELAVRMGADESAATRAVQSLEEKQFVTTVRARRKEVSRSTSAHASAFEALLALHPHVDFAEVLAHSSLRVLSAFTGRPCSVEKIARISRLPVVTVRRAVSKLMGRGILVRQTPGEYQIALSSLALQNFVQAYAVFAIRRKAWQGSLICVGPNALVRTERALPFGFALTGVSVLHRFGVPVVQTDYRDYWFNLFVGSPLEPSLEEAVVHALARSTILSSAREASYALLVLLKNWAKLDKQAFLKAAEDYNVTDAVERSISFVQGFILGLPMPQPPVQGFASRGGPLFPSVEEFRELVKQYA